MRSGQQPFDPGQLGQRHLAVGRSVLRGRSGVSWRHRFTRRLVHLGAIHP